MTSYWFLSKYLQLNNRHFQHFVKMSIAYFQKDLQFKCNNSHNDIAIIYFLLSKLVICEIDDPTLTINFVFIT